MQSARIYSSELLRLLRGGSNLLRSLFLRTFARRQLERVRRVSQQSPLILQLEVTNVCNALCTFCAYPHMERPKGVMPLPLFRKVVEEYAALGGGAVSLTPILGDALVDPHLLERLALLESHPAIRQISMTTNAIALDRYSDEEVRRILAACYCIQVSVGGLDSGTYHALYGVDRFPQVQGAMERLLRLNAALEAPAQITFAFRTNDRFFESRFKELLDGYRQQGAFVSHIWSYANYGGLIKEDPELNLVVPGGARRRTTPCIYAAAAMSVCWDGTVTACGCADFEARALAIGNAATETLAEIWRGKKRSALMASFGAGKLPPLCRECSAYQSDAIFAEPCCRGIRKGEALPLGFYRQIWGG